MCCGECSETLAPHRFDGEAELDKHVRREYRFVKKIGAHRADLVMRIQEFFTYQRRYLRCCSWFIAALGRFGVNRPFGLGKVLIIIHLHRAVDAELKCVAAGLLLLFYYRM